MAITTTPPPFLVGIAGSSVPIDRTECITPTNCQAVEYALRCETAWRKEFELNLILRTRIRELEAQIATSQ